MPNHYTTMAICSPGWEFDVAEFNERHAKSDLCAIVKPMPEDIEQVGLIHSPSGQQRVSESTRQPVEARNDWFTWAHDNWGTKWGTYGVKAFDMEGDSGPVVIKFQTAWNPPSILNKIAEWLCRTYQFERVVFVGFNPYNDSTTILETYEAKP